MGETVADRVALASLRRQWVGVTTGFALSLLAGWWSMSRLWPAYAGLWALMPVGVAVYVLWLLRHGLKDNHRPGEAALLPILGWGNGVSLFRGGLLCLLSGFVLIPEPVGATAWLPALLFLVASCLDLVDGYVARRRDQATALGATLDIELDGVGALIAIVLGIKYGDLPLWFLLLAPLRPLFIGGIGYRRRRQWPVYDMHPSIYRRIIAGLQVSVITAVLWPVVQPPASWLAGAFVALTVGTSFARDWLVTIGWLDAGSEAYWSRKERLKGWLLGWVPLLLRLLLGITAVTVVMDAADIGDLGQRFLWPAPGAATWTGMLFLLLFVIGGVMTGVGAAVRLSAALLAAATVPLMSHGGLHWSSAVLLVGSLYLFVSGGGRWTLWEPERRFFTEQLGKPRASR